MSTLNQQNYPLFKVNIVLLLLLFCAQLGCYMEALHLRLNYFLALLVVPRMLGNVCSATHC